MFLRNLVCGFIALVAVAGINDSYAFPLIELAEVEVSRAAGDKCEENKVDGGLGILLRNEKGGLTCCPDGYSVRGTSECVLVDTGTISKKDVSKGFAQGTGTSSGAVCAKVIVGPNPYSDSSSVAAVEWELDRIISEADCILEKAKK